MAFPAPSDFNKAEPFSAWVNHVLGNRITRCQTDGWSFLANVQQTLRERLQDSGPLPTISGSVAAGDVPDTSYVQARNGQITLSGPGWDLPLLRALYAVAQRDRAPASFLQSIAQDAQLGRVSPATLATAVWIVQFNKGVRGGQDVYGLGSPAEVRVPGNAILPMWGVRPPFPRSLASGQNSIGMTCGEVTAGTVSSTPGSTSLIPFTFNEWVVIGVVAATVAGVVYLGKNVEVKKKRRR